MTMPEEKIDSHLRSLENDARRLSAVAEAGREIGSLLELNSILELLIDKALEATGGETGSIMLLDEETGELTIHCHRGVHPFHAVDVKRRVGEGISGWVAGTGEPLHLVSSVEDPRFKGVYSEGEIVDALCAPLKYQTRLVGVISVNHYTGDTLFTNEDLHALVALGGYAAVAIQNARMYGELQERREVQEHLITRIITAQEDERRRIAADIHDGPAQAMAALQFRIDPIERLVNISPERARVELFRLQDAIREATRSLRRLLVEIRPNLLDDLGLVPALRQHLEAFRVNTGIRTTLDVPKKPLRLSQELETTIYRIVQEALNNVAKHSGASSVRVSIWEQIDTICASIEDNGSGFSPAILQEKKHDCLGVEGMRERARMVSGTLTIESSSETGTLIRIQAPGQRRIHGPGELPNGEEDENGTCQCAGG